VSVQRILPSFIHSVTTGLVHRVSGQMFDSSTAVFLELFYSIAPYSLSTCRFRPQA